MSVFKRAKVLQFIIDGAVMDAWPNLRRDLVVVVAPAGV